MKKYILLFLILLFAIPVFSQIKVGTITLRDSSGTLVISSGVKSNGTITFYYFNADSILIGGININNGGLTNVPYLNTPNVFASEQTFEDDILVTGLIYTQGYLSADDSILVGGLNINQARTLTNVAYKNDTNTFTKPNTFMDASYMRGNLTVGNVPAPANILVYGNIEIQGGNIDVPTILIGGVDINTAGTLTNIPYKNDTNTFQDTAKFLAGIIIGSVDEGIQANANVNGNVIADSIEVSGIINNGGAYGSVYIADDFPDTITVTATDVYYTVGAMQGANGKAWTSGGVLNSVTVRDSFITVQKAGKYEVSYSFSFQTITGVTNGYFNFYLFVNDVKQEKTGAKRLMSGTNDLGVGAIAPTVLELAADDEIKLKILSPTDNANTVCFQYAVLHVKKIDN